MSVSTTASETLQLLPNALEQRKLQSLIHSDLSWRGGTCLQSQPLACLHDQTATCTRQANYTALWDAQWKVSNVSYITNQVSAHTGALACIACVCYSKRGRNHPGRGPDYSIAAAAVHLLVRRYMCSNACTLQDAQTEGLQVCGGALPLGWMHRLSGHQTTSIRQMHAIIPNKTSTRPQQPADHNLAPFLSRQAVPVKHSRRHDSSVACLS